ncbi:MAG: DUF502 domain-containing protein, partial [Planctomycetes bacterium]|nr:DUF502 domain-containing protein [Planctomycetota bacterium]
LPESLRFPGVGLLLAVLIVGALGVLASASATRERIAALERVLLSVPGVKWLYGAVKDSSNALVGDTRRFDKPVLVQLGGGFDAGVIGFVTREDLASLGLGDCVAVYFPQSYNFGGNLLVLPRDRIRALEVDSARAIAFVVSGGVADTEGDHGATIASRAPPAVGLWGRAVRWHPR